MKKIAISYSFVLMFLFLLLVDKSIEAQTCPTCPDNLSFENGDFSSWTGSYGTYQFAIPTPVNNPSFSYPISGTGFPATRYAITSGTGNDPNVPIKVVAPCGGKNSARIGCTCGPESQGAGNWPYSESLIYTLNVTAANAGFTYMYAAVLVNGSHDQFTQPQFEVIMKKCSDNTLLPCGQYAIYAGSGSAQFTVQGNYNYTQWTSVSTDLTNYIGQQICITFRVRDCMGNLSSSNGNYSACSGGGHQGYAYIDTYCTPVQFTTPEFCAGVASIQICAPPGYKTYSWPSGQPGLTGSPSTQCVTVNSPKSGTSYTVNMTSNGGCPVTMVVPIKGIPVTKSSTNVSICPGASTTLTVSATGTNGPYTYSWSNGLGTQTSATVNPTTTTTYTVTVKNASGCTSDELFYVNILSCGPTITATGGVVCAGGCVNITTTASGGATPYTYTWNTGATTANLSVCPTSTTTYTVTTLDKNSVSASTTAVVTINPIPIVTSTGAAICKGASTMLNASGATTYSWSPITGLSSGTGASVTANPTVTTTYTVTGTNPTGCSGTTTVVVTVNPIPVVTVPGVTICLGASAPLTASGATTYTWSPTTGLSSGTGTTVTANPSVTTTYTVIGTTNGCTGSTTVVVTLLPTCGPGVNTTGSTVCEGVCGTASSTAFGGTPPYTYLWNTGATTTNIAECPTVTTTYTVTVTDNSAPIGSASAIAVITVNPNPIVSVPSAVICYGTSTTMTATGADTYAWSPTTDLNSGTGTTVTANPTVTTTYTVTGSNSTGCTGTTTVVVTVNPIPVVTVPDVSICPGGSTVLSATGATTYTWSPSTGLNSGTGATVTANPSVTTVYTVCGTTTGCSSCTTVTVSVGAIVATVSPNTTICFGASIPLIAKGGTSYSWMPATGLDNPNIANPIASPAVTTTYTVVVSNVSCSDAAVVIITVDPPITLNIAPVNVTCYGACNGQTIVIPSGGNGAYTYNWSSGCSTAACNKVCKGTYTLTVTDGVGCTATGTVTVTEPPPFTISAIGGNACPGDSIGLSVTGAVTYSWLPSKALSATTGANVIAKPNTTSTYTIVGTDASGCTAVTTVVAVVNPKPNASFITSPDKVDEFNPTVYFIDLSTGGTIKSWNWKFGDSANTKSILQNPAFVYPPFSSTYTVQLIVTNQFGCIDTVTGPVIIHGIFTFYIPNTFTPNNDGNNEGFLARGVGIDETDYHIWIFDRWGNLIWQTGIWGEAWDGRANKGADLAQIDTYVWKVHVKEKESGAKHNYIGHVNIVK